MTTDVWTLQRRFAFGGNLDRDETQVLFDEIERLPGALRKIAHYRKPDPMDGTEAAKVALEALAGDSHDN